jgi:hypothetical protein
MDVCIINEQTSALQRITCDGANKHRPLARGGGGSCLNVTVEFKTNKN